jgi:hypothetical protein
MSNATSDIDSPINANWRPMVLTKLGITFQPFTGGSEMIVIFNLSDEYNMLDMRF